MKQISVDSDGQVAKIDLRRICRHTDLPRPPHAPEEHPGCSRERGPSTTQMLCYIELTVRVCRVETQRAGNHLQRGSSPCEQVWGIQQGAGRFPSSQSE